MNANDKALLLEDLKDSFEIGKEFLSIIAKDEKFVSDTAEVAFNLYTSFMKKGFNSEAAVQLTAAVLNKLH